MHIVRQAQLFTAVPQSVIDASYEDVATIATETHDTPDGAPSVHYMLRFKDGSRALVSVTAQASLDSKVPSVDYAVRAAEVAQDLLARSRDAENPVRASA